MMEEHWFWTAIMAACMLWYATITVYIAIKGGFDIKNMLARLSKNDH